ncbi:hypothetical protein [Plantactinospora sp. CA-290183]|uniref:hypothetical protein n=1 Tax=Plantactinospora sp. CA-290183 TaxID=3240006 RepID=UPI003D92C0FA
MSTSADGDGRPENGPDKLPELPAEWGPIVIPDDPAELAAEAEQVRRELWAQAHRNAPLRRHWHILGGSAPARLAILIMSVLLLATLTSLFAIIWPGNPAPTPTVAAPTPAGTRSPTLPALDLLDEDGGLVSLRAALPAVIILTDDCACADEVAGALGAVPPGVAVVTVARRRAAPGPPSGAPPGTRPRALTDPTGELRTSLRLAPPPGKAAAVLVDRSGRILRTVPALSSVADYGPELAQLGTR